MTTTKSFSEKSRFFSLYQTALKHQLPMFVVFFILFFLSLVLPLVLVLLNDPHYFSPNEYYSLTDQSRQYGIYMAQEMSLVTGIFVGLMALITALESSAYLHQKRMVDLYHALPVTRVQLFSAKLLSSLTTIFAPLLINYLLATLVYGIFLLLGMPLFETSSPLFHLLYSLQDLTGLLLYALVIYLFVTFVSYHVGTWFDAFAISVVLGFAPMLVYAIPMMIWDQLTYGARFRADIYIVLLSPFTFLYYKFDNLSSLKNPFFYETLPLALLYLGALVAIALLLFLCVRSYNKRRSEKAEQTDPSGIFQIAVKIFATFCGAALFFVLFAETGLIGQLFGVVIGGVLIGTIAELILSRGLRGYKKNMKWLVGTGVAFAAFLLVLSFDLTGYEARVPTPESVTSVQTNYHGRARTLYQDFYNNGYIGMDYNFYTLTDPESIATVTNAHHLLVDNRPSHNYYSGEDYLYDSISLEYKLKTGAKQKRYYDNVSRSSVLELMNLESQDDFIAASHPLFYWQNGQLSNSGMTLSQITLYNNLCTEGRRINLNPADVDLLIESIKADLLAESLEGILHPTAPALGYITLQFSEREEVYYKNTPVLNVIVTEEYRNTIAFLQSKGHYDKMVSVPAATVESVYFLDSNYPTYEGGRVGAILPSNIESNLNSVVYNYKQDATKEYYGEIFGVCSDPAEIAAVEKASRNQMAVPGNTYREKVYYAVFSSDTEIIGARLIAYNDLPESIQMAVMERRDYR